MAQVYRVPLRDLRRLIHKHARARAKRVIAAIQKTATDVMPTIRERIPDAFGRLRKQIDTVKTKTGANIRDNAPYAAAVEVGSRPHTPPLGPLIDWALVKGMAKDLPEATAIALRVQQAIKRNGTRPTWYMRGSLPMIRERLGENIRGAMHQPDEVEPAITVMSGSSAPGRDNSSASSGKYRKNVGTFRGQQIHSDGAGRQYVRQRNGRIHYIKG